jgi:predicted neutral ceramidase superfamily lipid hydrolase
MTKTKGEYRVGIDFNPSASDMVGQIKRKAADLIDLIETITLDEHTANTDPIRASEIGRLKALAQTEIEAAAMWAVKAATKGAP